MSNQTIWTGLKDNNWLNALNWSKGIPSIDRHAFIPKLRREDRYPIISRNLKINFTLKNEGQINFQAEIYIMPNGILQNYGQITNVNTGTVINQGNVMNFGEWINEGTLENNKIFTNQHRCFNEGLIENHNTLVNIGSFVNTGTIDNFLAINNNGTLENFNIIENHVEGVVTNDSVLPIASEQKMEAFFHTLELNTVPSA